MVQVKNDGINGNMVLSPIQQNRLALSWELKIKKKLKTVPPCLGKFRPTVGACCHQCTPDSLRKKLGQNSSLGFHNLLSVNETHTRYRGWLVRRVCCALFVSGCKVYSSPVSNRLERVCQSNRVKEALKAVHKAPEGRDTQGQLNHLSPFLPLINTCISPGLLRFLSWVMLKMLSSVFGSIQVNLNHLPALHRASQEGSLLVYVHVRQSIVDCALIPLVLFSHSLRVPYTMFPLHITSSSIRSILKKVGVVLLPISAVTEQDAEMDSLYAPVMTSLVRELLHEGQALSVGVSAVSGRGGQWLARIRQLIKEGSVRDVNLVPVGISYDCVPKIITQVGISSVLQWFWSLLWRRTEGSVRIHFAQPFSLKEMCESRRCRVDEWLPLQDLLLPVILNNRTDSVFGGRKMSWLLPSSHYAAELKEPSDPERDLSIAIILHLIFSAASCTAVMSTSLVSSLLLYRHRKTAERVRPSCGPALVVHSLPEQKRRASMFAGELSSNSAHGLDLVGVDGRRSMEQTRSGADLAAVPHPVESLGDNDFLSHTHQSLTNTTRWLMLTSHFGTKLRPSPPQGVSASALCRDVAWLTEELLFRNKDVGFGGSLEEVVQYSLSLLAPHLIIAAVPSRKDPFIVPRRSLAATLHLTLQAQIVTHTFISEAVGACAVSAMLCELVGSGVSSRVRSDGVDGEQVNSDMEFDVVLCQSELTERALQLCHLLPPGFMPPCQSSQSFALDAVDSLVRCGILIMEEIPRDVPICDFWKKEGALSWTTTDDPYHSDSDCDMEEQDLRSYKISQPRQCPEMLFFLCSMLAGHLRALCWTTTGLDLLHTPLPEADFVARLHSHLCDTANKKKQHFESCSEEAAHTAVRSLIDMGVLSQECQKGGVFLGVSPLFQLSENRQKLHRFISQYLYN